MSVVRLGTEGMAGLMPMHLSVGGDGRVLSVGPTLRKLAAGHDPTGLPVERALRLRRPARTDTMAALRECAGLHLRLELVGTEPVRLVGIAVPTAEGGVLLNTSLGIGLSGGVREHGLTVEDFAPTDLAAEFLFLAEANTAALAEARRLAERLDAAREAARREASTDALTGLANRRALEHAARALCAAGAAFGLLSVDLDGFKAVNDRWGHEAGDAVLRAIADRLRRSGRDDDLAVRLGGDEFALLLRGAASEARLLEIANTTIRAIEKPIRLPMEMTKGGMPIAATVSASIGIARSGKGRAAALSDLLRTADASLYRAKRGGGGQALAAGRHRRAGSRDWDDPPLREASPPGNPKARTPTEGHELTVDIKHHF